MYFEHSGEFSIEYQNGVFVRACLCVMSKNFAVKFHRTITLSPFLLSIICLFDVPIALNCIRNFDFVANSPSNEIEYPTFAKDLYLLRFVNVHVRALYMGIYI